MGIFNPLQAIKKDKTLTLLVYGVIGGGLFDAVDASEINRQIEGYGDIEEINVRIHSPGGSIAEGCAIYNSLKNHKAKINVYIEGLCASIATVIAMAGNTIKMSPVATFMIHNPFALYTSGDAKKLRITAEALDKYKEVMINAYETKSKLNRQEISELMNKETYMTANEALKKGFVTDVADLKDNAKMVAMAKEFVAYENITKNTFTITTPSITEAKNKSNNIEEENNKMDEITTMTAEQFKVKYPDMFNNIYKQGVANERARLQELDIYLAKTVGAEQIIHIAKYVEPKKATDMFAELFDYAKPKADTETVNDTKNKSFLNKFNSKKDEAIADGVNDIKDIKVEALGDKEAKADLDIIENMAKGQTFEI
ncbi:MAG: Clp protease ClpP [Fusobacteriaceae bacterium]|jgi:ATP-dependent Clp endopeptidase proteolytic subunit ClpP|nr:Clp protease ClpP [Fusobacteriaceae bacterium]